MSQYRKPFEAIIAPTDQARIRAFIRNEIAYHNVLVAAFGSRVRTMPELLSEITDEVLANAVRNGVDRKDRSIPERVMLFLDTVAVQRDRLAPDTRVAMAVEMLTLYRKLALALTQTTRAVEMPSPLDERTKRHVQLPRTAVAVEGKALRIPYAQALVAFNGPSLPDKWNNVVIRDGGPDATWQIEFRLDPTTYVVGLTDTPIRRPRPDRAPARSARS